MLHKQLICSYNWIMLQTGINWLLSGLVVLSASYLLPGVHVESFLTALVVALVLGVVNILVKPLVFVLTLPLTLLTLGLFSFVINALMVVITEWLVPGFQVDGFLWAMLFSLTVSVLSTLVHTLFSNKEK